MKIQPASLGDKMETCCIAMWRVARINGPLVKDPPIKGHTLFASMKIQPGQCKVPVATDGHDSLQGQKWLLTASALPEYEP